MVFMDTRNQGYHIIIRQSAACSGYAANHKSHQDAKPHLLITSLRGMPVVWGPGRDGTDGTGQTGRDGTGYAAKTHMCYAEVRGTPVIKRLTFERAGTLGVRRWISRSELEWRRSEIPSIENALWC